MPAMKKTPLSRRRAQSGFGKQLAAHVRKQRDALVQRFGALFFIVLVVRTVKEMMEDDATHMAAGVAYYALFSLFPLVLALVALSGIILGTDSGLSASIEDGIRRFFTDNLPGSEQFVDDNLESLVNVSGALTLVAILGLFWSASAVFGAISRAVNRAWDVQQDRPFYVNKPRQLGMAAGVGILFLTSFGVAALVRASEGLAGDSGLRTAFNIASVTFLQLSSFVLMLSTFMLIYKFTPNTKTYWGFVWPGALFAAVTFELAKNLFIVYLSAFANFESVYGTLAPVIILLLWAYVSSLILIAGAEMSSEYGRLRSGVGRGRLIRTGRRA